MDLKYVARQLLRRPGHTLAVIACLVIGLVASVGTFSVITSLFYGDVPGIAGRRDLARIFLRYDSATENEPTGGGRRIVTAPLSFNDFAIMRDQPAATISRSFAPRRCAADSSCPTTTARPRRRWPS
jgi:hypothetical protein